MTSAIEAIRPFSDILTEGHLTKLQIIGGIGAVALSHPDTIINIEERSLTVPGVLDMPTRREDGSLRDIDVLVMSTNKKKIKKVEKSVITALDHNLESSVFGVKSGEVLQKQIAHPLGFSAFKTFLSDRYKTDDGLVKSVFPFAVPIDPESLQTWSLYIEGMTFPIPHPAMSIINYTNRSISGLRKKDTDKVEHMARLTFAKAPQLREWALDGPGASQVTLSHLLQQLTPRKAHAPIFSLTNQKMSAEDIISHEAFMLPDVAHYTKRQVLAIAAFKANSLAFFESNKTVVSMWRKIGENKLEFIVKNT